MNGPADPAAGNYYQQNGPWGSGNSSQNSSEGSLPMYNSNEQRLPGYNGPMAYTEEKMSNPFEDVKV